MEYLDALEGEMTSLLKGKFSELHLTFNDHASNYQTVAQAVEEDNWHGDWINDEERDRAIATNRAWSLQWYPDTPIGSYSVSASTLEALLTHCLSREPSK